MFSLHFSLARILLNAVVQPDPSWGSDACILSYHKPIGNVKLWLTGYTDSKYRKCQLWRDRHSVCPITFHVFLFEGPSPFPNIFDGPHLAWQANPYEWYEIFCFWAYCSCWRVCTETILTPHDSLRFHDQKRQRWITFLLHSPSTGSLGSAAYSTAKCGSGLCVFISSSIGAAHWCYLLWRLPLQPSSLLCFLCLTSNYGRRVWEDCQDLPQKIVRVCLLMRICQLLLCSHRRPLHSSVILSGPRLLLQSLPLPCPPHWRSYPAIVCCRPNVTAFGICLRAGWARVRACACVCVAPPLPYHFVHNSEVYDTSRHKVSNL